MAAATRVLTGAGVPADALVVERAEHATQQLNDEARPLVGGVAIGGVGGCSLGFPAVLGGVAGFVTASHCTSVQAAPDGTVFRQPYVGPPVAVETSDPLPFAGTGGCPTVKLCRYSDSAFATLIDPAHLGRGLIARPAEGSTVWNGVDTFRITSEAALLPGDPLTKVGARTGRTSGVLGGTCVDLAASKAAPVGTGTTPTPFFMLCQNTGSYRVDDGDSGGPVVSITSGNDVILAGVHWRSGGGFSPIANIQQSGEFGPVDTCAAGFTC